MDESADIMQRSNTFGHGSPSSTIAPYCMIIEDEAGIRSIISRALSGHGITASEFGDVQTAISSLAKDDPKVIFLDVSLGDSDAIDAIRELAERKFSGAVQLISGQSAGTLAEIKKIGERHGLRMCPPIAKPFTADAIYRVIAQEEVSRGARALRTSGLAPRCLEEGLVRALVSAQDRSAEKNPGRSRGPGPR